jgi:hypothetical protein
MSPSSLTGRNIVVAIYRDNLSPEANKAFKERVRAEDNEALTKSWCVYEDWNPKELRKGQIVIDIDIGDKGGVKVTGPEKIFEVMRIRRKEGGSKGQWMTLHYANHTDNLMGIPKKIALAGIKERVEKRWADLLPIESEARVIPIEEFVSLI